MRAGRGARPRGFADPRPEQTERAEFGERCEFVGVRRHAERHRVAGRFKARPVLGQRAQIAHRRADREGELLRGRAPRRMDRARVGGKNGPRKPSRFRLATSAASARASSSQRANRAPGARVQAEGIEAEADVDGVDARAAARDQRGKPPRLRLGVSAEVQLQRDAFVEPHALEGAMQRGGVPFGEAEAIGARGAGEHDLQSVGAVGEVLERLRVGVAGLGVIDAGEDAPRPAASARRARPRAAPVKRGERDAVRGFRVQRLERSALERRLRGLAPIRLAVAREGAGKVQQSALRRQMNCARPGIAADISPTTSSPAALRA